MISLKLLLEITLSITMVPVFLAPIPSLRRLIKKGPTDVISPVQFIMGLVMGSLWLRYCQLTNDYLGIRNNQISLFLSTCYVSTFCLYARNKVAVLKKVLLFMSVIAAIFLILSRFPEQKQRDVMGSICVVFTLFAIFSPLIDMKEVFRQKSTENMPLPMIAVGLIFSAQLFAYAFLQKDIYMMIPSGFGTAVSAFQASLFFIFPRHTQHSKQQ